ncbi:MAG: [citrate (pro-3S)-lyase] ligase [bacterium]|nr:[citrate (pro-3S)-lyase] ligase [bacterium]
MDNYSAATPVQVSLNSSHDRARLTDFLESAGLRMESGLEYYAAITDPQTDDLIAGGGFEANVIKCVATAPQWRGLGLINTIISHLRSELRARGSSNIFIYTKPDNLDLFQSLAFYLVGSSPLAILMESSKRALARFKRELSNHKKPGLTGAIVLNANPFTLGHRFLIETAAQQCDQLVLFPVKANRSEFSYEERLNLIRAGTADLPNVEILNGGDYIISPATFPSYFLKKLDEAALAQAQLDMNIFSNHIAPSLNIGIRWVGSEPLDPLTNAYNEVMRAVLEPSGIKVKLVERLDKNGTLVSASAVRNFLKTDQWDEVQKLVPPSTWKYLHSEAGQKAVDRLKAYAQ